MYLRLFILFDMVLKKVLTIVVFILVLNSGNVTTVVVRHENTLITSECDVVSHPENPVLHVALNC